MLSRVATRASLKFAEARTGYPVSLPYEPHGRVNKLVHQIRQAASQPPRGVRPVFVLLDGLAGLSVTPGGLLFWQFQSLYATRTAITSYEVIPK